MLDSLSSTIAPSVLNTADTTQSVVAELLPKTTINDLFGAAATSHFNDSFEPIINSTQESLWQPQFAVFLILFILTSLIIYKFSNEIARIFSIVFSFPRLARHVSNLNSSLDSAARAISLILFLSLPIALLTHNESREIKLFDSLPQSKIALSIATVFVLYLYTAISKFGFYRLAKNRYFYRKLFISERVCLAAYATISLPFITLAAVNSPFRTEFIFAQFIVIVVLYLHYLITNFKFFIEEKVSYIQLILYFCIVKAVVLSIIIYYGIYVI